MVDNTTHAVATQSISRKNELTIGDYICLQCIELRKLEELKSARLIIELLQQESSTRITSNQDCVNTNNISHIATNQVINADWVEVSTVL
jgi:hypothetical protein